MIGSLLPSSLPGIATMAIIGLLSLAVVFGVVFVMLPLVMCIVAAAVTSSSSQLRNSVLYTGRVWHTRLHPKKHAFTYPIFMFALDLEELDAFRNSIWPLSNWIVDFREPDHLKNGEGLAQQQQHQQQQQQQQQQTSGERGSSESEGESDSDDLVGARTGIHARILRLVAEKTNHKFRPLPTTHRVTILTHLCYYGYNFNPVSFYYVVDKKTEEIEAMVGEVSNTPWTEMYCYVLHPDSTDQVATTTTTTTTTNLKKAKTTKNSNEKETQTQPPQPPPSMNTNNSHSDSDSVQKVEYSFPKSFHVSPFMEMDYWYDWTFAGVPSQNKNRNRNSSIPLTVINTLRKRNNNRIEFTAKLVLDGNHSITPWTVVWELIKFPMLCVLLQIWIHYQAALLFLKGIVYVPHPQGSETAASVMIAKLMVPFFAIRDYFDPKSKTA